MYVLKLNINDGSRIQFTNFFERHILSQNKSGAGLAPNTIRGMEPELECEILLIAKKSGKLLNRVIIDMIQQNRGF